jgi:hypothetical protein
LAKSSFRNSLEGLEVSHTPFDDFGAEQLTGYGNLKVLLLVWTKITDTGIKYICEISSLECIDLTGTAATDACIDDLRRLPSLQQVGMLDSSISHKRLAKEFPHLFLAGLMQQSIRFPDYTKGVVTPTP